MCSNFLRFLTSSDLDLSPFQLKIGNPLMHALGNVYTNFNFSTFFCFWVMSQYRTDGQTDRQTERQMGKMCNAAYRTAAYSYNSISIHQKNLFPQWSIPVGRQPIGWQINHLLCKVFFGCVLFQLRSLWAIYENAQNDVTNLQKERFRSLCCLATLILILPTM